MTWRLPSTGTPAERRLLLCECCGLRGHVTNRCGFLLDRRRKKRLERLQARAIALSLASVAEPAPGRGRS